MVSSFLVGLRLLFSVSMSEAVPFGFVLAELDVLVGW
jgi:hypothetical protein